MKNGLYVTEIVGDARYSRDSGEMSLDEFRRYLQSLGKDSLVLWCVALRERLDMAMRHGGGNLDQLERMEQLQAEVDKLRARVQELKAAL